MTERIVSLRGREGEPRVMELLATAQVHRPAAERAAQGPRVASWYAEHGEAELWGLERDGELVGVAGVDPEQTDGVMLMDLAALDGRQRGGVGTSLVAFLRERFPSRVLFGDTVDSALGFYQRLGFETVKTADHGRREGDLQAYYQFRLPAHR